MSHPWQAPKNSVYDLQAHIMSFLISFLTLFIVFPAGSDSKRVCLQGRRPGFHLWVGKIPWKRKWKPTPVLLPGKSHGWRSLVDYSPWGRKRVRHDWMTSLSLYCLSIFLRVPPRGFWEGLRSSQKDFPSFLFVLCTYDDSYHSCFYYLFSKKPF